MQIYGPHPIFTVQDLALLKQLEWVFALVRGYSPSHGYTGQSALWWGLLNSGITEAQEIDSICGLQIAAALGTGITWQKALHEWPQVLGKENPFNDQIEAIFKDQGGH